MKIQLIFLLIFFSVFKSGFAQIVSDNLVAAYPFTGNANDSLGGVNGVVVGAALTNGFNEEVSGAYEFDGNDDNQLIEIHDSIIDQTADFTIQFWVKIDSLYTTNVQTNYLVLSRHAPDGSEQGGVEFNYGDGGDVNLVLRGVSPPAPLATATASVPYLNGWFSITGRKEADTIKLYINGLLMDSAVMSNASIHTTSDFWTIGASYWPSQGIYREIDGAIDDVLFYDAALDDCEIYHLYQRHQYEITTNVESDYNGYGVSCNGLSDGMALVNWENELNPITLLWSNGDTNDTIVDVFAGTYNVTVEDAVGCKDSAEVTITEPAQLVANATSQPELFGNDGAIDLSISGGVPSYEVDWDLDGNGDFDDTEDLSSVIGGNYQVVVRDANQCTDTLSVFVDSQLSTYLKDPEQFKVYPNPTVDKIWFSVFQKKVQLMDINGRLVKTYNHVQQIDISDLEKGTYTVIADKKVARVILQ